MLTRTDIATLAERSLKKNGYLDPLFIFEGTKDIQIREFPNLPKKALLDSLEALGFIFAYTDQIGELVHIFFLCQAWFNRDARIRAMMIHAKWRACFSISATSGRGHGRLRNIKYGETIPTGNLFPPLLGCVVP